MTANNTDRGSTSRCAPKHTRRRSQKQTHTEKRKPQAGQRRDKQQSAPTELDAQIAVTTQKVIQLGMEADFEGAKLATKELKELKRQKTEDLHMEMA
jgi:hypothetical protein